MTKNPRVNVLGELVALRNPARAALSGRYFKTGPGEYGEGDRFLGLTVPQVRDLARRHGDLPLATVSSLLKSPWHEARQLALFVLVRQYLRGDAAARARIHDLYLSHTRWINNWDLVDCSAEVIVGRHLAGRRAPLGRLAHSKSLWERRIAVIATFDDIKRGAFDTTLWLAALLLRDPEDLIHKAAGWMLREVAKKDRHLIEAFLDTHASQMPRTMLRYAIERFPETRRRHYLNLPRARPSAARA